MIKITLKIYLCINYPIKTQTLLLDFQKHIDANFSFLKNKKLLIAISGGVDSVVLTHLLNQLNFDVALAHCNFRLRGNASDLDEAFVQNLVKKLQNNYYVTSFETENYAIKNNISIQMAARDLRYAWFEKLIKKHNYDYLLTAHHADDNLETFLINLSRGTGLDGLTGIPAINNQIIRPLLPFTRKEIETYANNNNISWREDLSNAETKYLRNKLRHDVIPLLKEINPNLLESFTKTIEHLKGSKQIVQDRIHEVKKEVTFATDKNFKPACRQGRFKIQNLKSLNNPKAYLFEILNTYGFTEWDDVLNLLEAQSGKQVFSKTHRLVKDREYLILDKINIENQLNHYKFDEGDTDLEIQNLKFKIQNGSWDDFKDLEKNGKNIIHIDKSLLTFPLTVRKWENGDYFYPLGMRGKKKLSKYFKDGKLSVLDKENIWLLCSSNDIVWVINHRQDERFKVIKSTKYILKIESIA